MNKESQFNKELSNLNKLLERLSIHPAATKAERLRLKEIIDRLKMRGEQCQS